MTDPALHECLLDIYRAAYSPLSATVWRSDFFDVHQENVTVRDVDEQWRLLQRLAMAGFRAFTRGFELLSLNTATSQTMLPYQNPETAFVLVAAGAFAQRLSAFADRLNVLCIAAAEKTGCDPTALIQDLRDTTSKMNSSVSADTWSRTTSMDVSLNIVRDCYDCHAPLSDWYRVCSKKRNVNGVLCCGCRDRGKLEIPLKNRVGFKSTAAIISEGDVHEERLRVSAFRRKKKRNPTGYLRFHFKDLGLDDSDRESEAGQRSRASSARAGSTDGSFTGTTGIGETPGSFSSNDDDDELEEVEHSGRLAVGRKGSEVVFSYENEREIIEDKEADPTWDETRRHQQRFSRIRNRVPTGHPSLTRKVPEELCDLIQQFEKCDDGTHTEEVLHANATQENMKAVPHGNVPDRRV